VSLAADIRGHVVVRDRRLDRSHAELPLLASLYGPAMSHEWKPPPDPPPLDEDSVRRLASYFDDMARHLLDGEIKHEIDGGGFLTMRPLLNGALTHLNAAMALRYAYDLDLHFYGEDDG